MNDEQLLNEVFGEKETSIDIALSYSRLSDVDRNGPIALVQRNNLDDVKGARIGSITDDLFNEDFDFDSKYYIFEGNKPTAMTGKLVDIIIKNYNEIPSVPKILDIIKTNDYWKGSTDETRIDKFLDNEEFYGYIKAFYESKNKIVVTKDELALGEELVYVLKNHEFSKPLFNDNRIRYNQVKFNITYRGIKLRGILDFVFVDTLNKTVQFIDLKTGKDEANSFLKSFIKWRYYLQEAIYTKAFKSICKSLGLKGYKLLPFEFLYISRYEKIPLRWEVSDKWHKAAIKGFVTDSGYIYKGLDEIIEDVKWYWQNQVFDMPKNIYQSKGKIVLQDNFIKINS